MNFKPILFSTPMILAILEGRKTQTRRMVKLKMLDPSRVGAIYPDGTGKGWVAWSPGKGVSAELTRQEYPDGGFPCPYGSVGDVLWVRESWNEYYAGPDYRYAYRADDAEFPFKGWKPSIHMAKAACRIFLEITDIRVERLKDISEEDARAEGVKPNGEQEGGEWFHYMRGFDDFPAYSASESFFSLWEKINGKESLDANPWTWAITFKRIDKPEGFA